MIGLPGHARVLLFAEPADMRKGHPGLYGLVRAAGEDPYSGDLFVFLSRRRNGAKVLTFDKGGFVVLYKRLERGRFRHPRRGEAPVVLDATELTMLLDGIDLDQVRRLKHWTPPRKIEAGGSTARP
jgi:transposase